MSTTQHTKDTQSSSEQWVYLLRCRDNTLYAGWTTDPARRLKVHNSGKGAKYTRSRLPVELVYCERCADQSQALKRECELKRMTRAQKERLIASAESTHPGSVPPDL